MAQFTAGPSGFARSISRSNLAENLSQYSRRNSDNASDPGGSSTKIGAASHNNSTMGPPSKVNMNNSISGVGNSGSFGQNSFYKNKQVANGQAASNQQPGGPNNGSTKKIDKKKVLPVTKKFPELKLMINGEQRNHNNSLSSDDENFNVSPSFDMNNPSSCL